MKFQSKSWLAVILLVGILISILLWKATSHADHPHDAHDDEHAHHASEGHSGHDDEHDDDQEDERQDSVRIAEESRIASRIGLDTVKSGTIHIRLALNGKVIPNEDGLAHLFARFPGVVKEVRRQLGETIRKGDTLALVESNESLQAYAIRSQLAGTIIRKHITVGETVGSDEELFAIADLRTVWADFSVYRHDFSQLRKGQTVEIWADSGTSATTTLAYLSPIGSEQTQTMTARAVLDNANGLWPPGLYIKGEVVLGTLAEVLTVRREAVHTYEGKDVVFVRAGETFLVRPIQLGRRDAEWVEVKSGIEKGEAYATDNSFIVKSDLGKSEVGHDH